jgi:hypothetical protein
MADGSVVKLFETQSHFNLEILSSERDLCSGRVLL